MPAISVVTDSSSPAAAEAARLLWPKTTSGPPGRSGARSGEQAGEHAGGHERGHGLEQRGVQADGAQDDQGPGRPGRRSRSPSAPATTVRWREWASTSRPRNSWRWANRRRTTQRRRARRPRRPAARAPGPTTASFSALALTTIRTPTTRRLDQGGRGVDHDHLGDRGGALPVDPAHQRRAHDARDVVVDQRGQEGQRVGGVDVAPARRAPIAFRQATTASVRATSVSSASAVTATELARGSSRAPPLDLVPLLASR